MQMMLERLRDKQPAIRCQAALALARLADPGEEGDFVGDSVTDSYIKLLGTEKNKVTEAVSIVMHSRQNPVDCKIWGNRALFQCLDGPLSRRNCAFAAYAARMADEQRLSLAQQMDLICRMSGKPCCTPCPLRPAACQTSWTGPETSTMRWAPLIQLQQGLSGSQYHAITSAQQALLLCMCSAVGMSVGKDPCSVLTHAT